MLNSVLALYGIDNFEVGLTGSGLINTTWKISCPKGQFILQKINTAIFKEPKILEDNIGHISSFLKKNHPGYLLPFPLPSLEGRQMVLFDEGFYRLFPFIQGSHTVDVVNSPEIAFEAARKFGELTRLLSGFQPSLLKETIPHFHDLQLRYQQFEAAVEKAGKIRRVKSSGLIEEITQRQSIVAQYLFIKSSPDFKLRVMHHDTKISNVLFTANSKGLCVIDLDTVMPGHIISDMGDMLRTYLSPLDENQKDTSLIVIREKYFKAIVKAYYQEMNQELTSLEKQSFVYAGNFMIYMQAIRFLTDYLQGDLYYPCTYELHNFDRAFNQMVLLSKLDEKKEQLLEIVSEIIGSGI